MPNETNPFIEPDRQTIVRQATALAHFLDVWTSDPDLLTELGPKLTCQEANALGDLLLSYDYPNAHDVLLDAHSEGDESGDDEEHLQIKAANRTE